MPRSIRNTASQSIAGVAVPGSRRTSGGSVNDLWSGASIPALAIPTLSSYSYGADTTFTFTITNYDAAATYVLATTAGSISRSTNTCTVSGLGNGGTATASVTATKSGFANSPVAQVTGQSKPACSSCGTATYGLNGCNGATCGVIACASGTCPAYDAYYYFSPTPNPCVGCAAAVGSWYCCTVTCSNACG